MTHAPGNLAKFVDAFFMSKLLKNIFMLSTLALSFSTRTNSNINYSEILISRAEIQWEGRMTCMR